MQSAIWSERRPLTIGLIGLGAALAWSALALFFGGTNAYADDGSEGPLEHLTSSLTSAGGEVVDEVPEVTTQTVEDIAPVVPVATAAAQTAAVEVVKPVAKAVASAPVVGANPDAVTPSPGTLSEKVNTAVEESVENTVPIVATVAPVLDPVTPPLTAPLAHLLGDSPLTHTADFLIDTIEPLPIVGSTLSSLGPTLQHGAETGDAILGALSGLVGSALDPIIMIDAPEILSPPAVLQAAETNVALNFDNAHVGGVAGGSLPSSLTSVLDRSAHEGVSHPLTPGTPLPPGSSAPATSATPAGGSAGPVALITPTGLFSSLELVGTVGAQNQTLPISPIFGTDVSPD